VTVTGLVLAAGGSKRLGEPKQLLPFRGQPLLAASLEVARGYAFDQLIVTLGAAAAEIEASVDLDGFDVVRNADFASGCASSIAKALDVVDPAASGIVLLLGDQPGIHPWTIEHLVSQAGPLPLGVCRYDDGRGHPFWLGRAVFGELASLHGDKGVWKVIESGRHTVVEVLVSGPVPIDVDTRRDYKRLLKQDKAREHG
jgi:molybdenum cofactor cytidylyltransferase